MLNKCKLCVFEWYAAAEPLTEVNAPLYIHVVLYVFYSLLIVIRGHELI